MEMKNVAHKKNYEKMRIHTCFVQCVQKTNACYFYIVHFCGPFSIDKGHFLSPYCVPYKYKMITLEIHHCLFTKLYYAIFRFHF